MKTYHLKDMGLTEKDLISLRIFCTVAKIGGITASENILHMSKATISRHIKSVEQSLGVQLCERGPSGFRLTAAGEVVLKKTYKAFDALEAIKTSVDEVQNILSGTLTIGIVEHILLDPQCKIVESLNALYEKAPLIKPELKVLTHAQLNRALLDKDVHIAIRGKYHHDSIYFYKSLFIETQKLYISKSVSTERTLPLIHRSHPFIETLLAAGSYTLGPEAEGLESVATLIATGRFVGLLPVNYASQVSKRYPLKEVQKTPVFNNQICAITDFKRLGLKQIQLFFSILEKQYTDVES